MEIDEKVKKFEDKYWLLIVLPLVLPLCWFKGRSGGTNNLPKVSNYLLFLYFLYDPSANK